MFFTAYKRQNAEVKAAKSLDMLQGKKPAPKGKGKGRQPGAAALENGQTLLRQIIDQKLLTAKK